MRSYFKHLIRTWSQHFALQIATMVVLTGTFTVISLSFLVHHNLDMVLSHWGDSIRMSVFLKDGDEQSQSLEAWIQKQKGVENLKYISKSDAADLFKEQVKNFVPDMVFDSGSENPLPASYEIKFDRTWSKNRFNVLVDYAKSLAEFPEVDDVSYGQGWIENYAAVVEKFNTSSLLLIFVLLAGSLFVVSNSIRNSVSQRRDEIEILELIGTTPWKIRSPYIFEGFVTGLLSSTLSLVLCYLIFRWQMNVLDSGIGLWGGQFVADFLSAKTMIAIIFQGGIFGILGSYFCVSKISNGWAALRAET